MEPRQPASFAHRLGPSPDPRPGANPTSAAIQSRSLAFPFLRLAAGPLALPRTDAPGLASRCSGWVSPLDPAGHHRPGSRSGSARTGTVICTRSATTPPVAESTSITQSGAGDETRRSSITCFEWPHDSRRRDERSASAFAPTACRNVSARECQRRHDRPRSLRGQRERRWSAGRAAVSQDGLGPMPGSAFGQGHVWSQLQITRPVRSS
jgi:hypothetical protein